MVCELERKYLFLFEDEWVELVLKLLIRVIDTKLFKAEDKIVSQNLNWSLRQTYFAGNSQSQIYPKFLWKSLLRILHKKNAITPMTKEKTIEL